MSDQIPAEADVKSAKSPKPKGNLARLLKTILKILVSVVITVTVLSNLFLLYVIIAPDDLPKPFYFAWVDENGQLITTAANIPFPNPAGTQSTTNEQASTSGSETATGSGSEANTTGGGGESGGGEAKKAGLLIDTGTKIVNLNEPGGRRFIRAGVTIEFAPPDETFYTMTGETRTAYIATFNEEMASYLPIINDTIITILSTKNFQSLYSAEGKDALRLEILESIKTKLPEFKVLGVYLTEFVMQ